MNKEKKRFLSAMAIMIGTCIGAGVLGIPYVAAQAGFMVTLGYIILLGGIILLSNLYLGEVSLRTKGNHQIPGYAEKYLGKAGGSLMEFATLFGVYSAVVAYLLGVGESLSFLFFGNIAKTLVFSLVFGILMAGLLWKGVEYLKRFEKIGVAIVLLLLFIIIFVFSKEVNISNLTTFNVASVLLPFGVVLFALGSFHAVPEVERIMKRNEHNLKKVLIFGTLIPIIFYILFTLIVVGYMGVETPDIATLALGKVFVILGIFTMFTSYLSLGNALQENFLFDEKMRKPKAWLLTAISPIILFLITRFWDVFSFTKILSVGGVVSGGLTGVLVLMMVKEAKKKGNRKPEYSIPINWFIIGTLSLVYILGVIYELFF